MPFFRLVKLYRKDVCFLVSNRIKYSKNKVLEVLLEQIRNYSWCFFSNDEESFFHIPQVTPITKDGETPSELAVAFPVPLKVQLVPE